MAMGGEGGGGEGEWGDEWGRGRPGRGRWEGKGEWGKAESPGGGLIAPGAKTDGPKAGSEERSAAP